MQQEVEEHHRARQEMAEDRRARQETAAILRLRQEELERWAYEERQRLWLQPQDEEQQLAQDELDKRDREEVHFDPSKQLGAQMLHSYAVHVNPQYEGITLDLAVLAEELEHFENSMSPEEFEKLVAKGAGISFVPKRSTKRSNIKASPTATPSAVTAQEAVPQESEV